MSKIEFIKTLFQNHGVNYRIDLDGESLDIFYHLCQTGILDETKKLSSECSRYVALYYKIIQKNRDKMLFYLQMSVNDNNDNAMNILGSYYEEQGDIDNMMKYYLMAIERGNTDAMTNLGSFYADCDDFIHAEKYYQMAINNGNSDAMYYISLCYQLYEDYDNMKKYLLMAIENGNINAALLLGNHYEITNDYFNMIKYYVACESKRDQIWDKLKRYIPNDQIIDYFLKIQKRIQWNIKQLQIKYDAIACLIIMN